MEKCVAVIFAGGLGKRMKSGDIPKQFLEVDQKPILVYTLEVFQNHPEIEGIIVVCISSWIDRTKELISAFGLSKVIDVIPGGETGHESRLLGLRCAKKHFDDCIVLIHDGVRPLIDAVTISNAIDCTKRNGSAVVCAPAIETISYREKGMQQIIPRENCSLLRAPQCFFVDEILEMYEKSFADGNTDVIDSVTLMQMFGKSVPVVLGPAENIKITTPLDFYMFEGIMKNRKNQNGID